MLSSRRARGAAAHRHSATRALAVASAVGAAVLALSSCATTPAPSFAADPVATIPEVVMTLPPPTGVEVSANGCPLQRIGGPVPARKLEIDLGLAAGTFHRYVLGPWKAHQFNGFGKNHPEAVAKMRETVALDLRLVSSAIAKVHNDPVLCNRLSTSLNRLHSELANIPVGIPKGHGASIGNAQGALSHTLVRATNSGLKIRETIHTSMVSQS